MKNRFRLSSILALTFSFALNTTAQNWVTTNLTSYDAFAIYDIVSHENTLYAIYSNSISSILNSSDDDGLNWNTPTASNITGDPTLLTSAGTKLYMATNYFFIDSFLYYSTDGGETFTQDMDGLPMGSFGGSATITSLQVLDNKLVVGMGGNGYYFKPLDNPTATFANFDTPTSLNAGTDPLVFWNGDLYTYDNAGAMTFYRSSNFGSSWTVPSANGLPSDLVSEIFEVNPTNGRIYLSGTSGSDSVYDLYYSDDGGENWIVMDLSVVSSTNYLGDFHKVTALYVSGELFYAAFDNDIDGSHPDVIKSNNFSAVPPSLDVAGLPSDAPGNIHGTKIILHNNKPTLALNIVDVYIKDQALSISEFVGNDKVEIFPTVVKSKTTLKVSMPSKVSIYDLNGKVVMDNIYVHSIKTLDLDNLKHGIYLIRFTSDFGTIVKRVVKV